MDLVGGERFPLEGKEKGKTNGLSFSFMLIEAATLQSRGRRMYH